MPSRNDETGEPSSQKRQIENDDNEQQTEFVDANENNNNNDGFVLPTNTFSSNTNTNRTTTTNNHLMTNRWSNLGHQQQQQQHNQQHVWDQAGTPLVSNHHNNNNNMMPSSSLSMHPHEGHGNNNFGTTPSMDVAKWGATPLVNNNGLMMGAASTTSSNGSGGGRTSMGNTFLGGQTPLVGADAGAGAATAIGGSGTNFGATPLVSFAGDSLNFFSGATASASRFGQQIHQQESRFGQVDQAMLAGLTAALQQQQQLQSGMTSSNTIAEDYSRLTATEKQIVVRMLEAKRYISDAQLDDMLPPGYSIVEPPANYNANNNNNNNNSNNLLNQSNNNAANATTESMIDAALQESAARRRSSSNNIGGARLDLPSDGVLSEDLPPLSVEDIVIFELLIEYKGMLDSEIPPVHVKKVQVLRALLRFKNGKPTQRRSGFRDLTTRARYYGVDTLIPPIIDLWRSEGAMPDEVDRHRVVKLLGHLLLQFRGILPAPQIRDVLKLVQPLLGEADNFTRQEGREVMSSLIKSAGFDEMVKSIRGDMESPNIETRRAAAQTICVIAETLGFEASGVMKLVDVLCRARKNWYIRDTGARTITEIARSARLGVSVCRRFIEPLVAGLVECLRFEHSAVKMQAAVAVRCLAEAIRPFGYEAFIPALPLLREQIASTRTKSLLPAMRAVASVMVLMPLKEAREQANVLVDPLQRCFANADDEFRRVALHIVDQILSHDGITPEWVRENLLIGFLNAWNVHSFVERQNIRQLLETTANFAKKVSGVHIIAHLRERLEQDGPTFQSQDHVFIRSVCEAIRIIAERAPFAIAECSDHEIGTTFKALAETLARDREGTCSFLEDSIASFIKQAGSRFAPLAPDLVRRISSRLGDRHLRIRRQAANLLAKTVKTIGESAKQSIDSLRDAWTTLDKRIIKEHQPALVTGGSENDAGASLADKTEVGFTIAAGLRACSLTLEVWCSYGRAAFNSPLKGEAVEHVKELLDAVAFALKSPLFKHNEVVKEQCIRSVLTVIELCESGIEVASPDSLHGLAVGSLITLLEATSRRQTRQLTTLAFGKVANQIGPIHIIKKLIENGLRRDDQSYRKCAAIALAVVAKDCGPFVVIPFLVFEYEQCKGTPLAIKIQHAVLKTVRFIFEYIAGDADAVGCVHALLPLLERALTERELQHRRLACEAVREMILACAGGVDNEGVMRGVWLHLINFIIPTILEPIANGKEQRKAVSCVVEILEAARLVLPAAYLLQLLQQGMFHPATFVRDVYWNAFNTIAVGEQLVACYPTIPDDDDDDNNEGGDDDDNNDDAAHEKRGKYRRTILEAIV